jgi:hypothetical protein
MERHRCTRCRNPIRTMPVRGRDTDAWFHADCWAEACSSEQEDYERQVACRGLVALLAPYVSTGVRAQWGPSPVPSLPR